MNSIITIKNQNYFMLRVESDYEKVKSFDVKEKLKDYKLQNNECFVVVSQSLGLEKVKVLVVEINVKIF